MMAADVEKNNTQKKSDEKKKGTEETYEVASQWQLMWWKFRKHRLAGIAGPILIMMYVSAIFADFLAPHVQIDRFTNYKFCSPSIIHLDGNGLYVRDMDEVVDPVTFKTHFTEVEGSVLPIKFFTRGSSYKLLGLFKTNVHFVGLGYDETTEMAKPPFFLLGTDKLGRDLWSRILYGSRISLSFGLVTICVTLLLGLTIGGLSGYLGGITDTVIQRAIDLLVCIPTTPLWMALAAALPRDWAPLKLYFGMCIVMSFIGWGGLARVTRGKILSLREEDFTMAARLCGSSHFRIIRKHLIPSFMSYIIVNATISIPGSILGETSLSFLGLGLQPPVVSWGVLLQDSQKLETLAHHPWLLYPAACIIIIVLMFNFLGDGLRDAADPYK